MSKLKDEKKLVKGLKWNKVSQILRNEYVKTILLAVILFLGTFAFWFGLKFAFRTDFPLLAVASGSMEPVLYRGDLIVVQGGLDFSELNAAPKDADPPGEVIVYYDPRYGKESPFLPVAGTETHLIVHRAVEKYQHQNGTWFFETKGDANWGPSYDPWGPIPEDYVVGKVVGKVPGIGHIPLFMHEHSVLATLIIVLLFVILILVDFVFPQKGEKKTKGEKE